MAKDYELEKRKFVIGGVAIVIILVYLLRLFSLQMLSEDFKRNADSNAFLKRIQYPARGGISDRNGKLFLTSRDSDDKQYASRRLCLRGSRVRILQL